MSQVSIILYFEVEIDDFTNHRDFFPHIAYTPISVNELIIAAVVADFVSSAPVSLNLPTFGDGEFRNASLNVSQQRHRIAIESMLRSFKEVQAGIHSVT